MKLKLKDIVILIILFTICTAIIFYGFIFKKDSVQLNTNYYEGIYDSSFTVVEGGSSGSSKNHELLFFKNMSNNAWNSGTVYVTPGTTIYFDQGTAYVAKWTVSSGSESFSINESSWYEGNGTVGSNAPLGSTFVIKCTRTGATDREIDFEVVWEENIAYNVNNSNSSNSYKSEMKPTRSKTVTWTLPTTDPTATGYNFLGWYDGSTYVGKAGNTYSKTYTEHNQTTTLTASWEAIKYKVEFDSNGGTGTMELQDFTYNQSQALTPNSFTRPGYEFKGWATSASSSKVEYGDNQNISNLSATDGDKKTLYAVWEKIPEYNITYDLDGGTSTNKSTWKKSDGEIELKDASKSGYEFLGWYTDKTFTNKITVLNSSTVTRDITIYARFEMKYTIEHYYQNLDNNQYTKDSSKTDTATAKLGTQISSYSDKAGTGFEFKEVKPTILTIAENSDNTMKVYYDRILMEISFENTGDSTIPSQTIKYGGTLEEPSIKPSRKGYEFTGWYLDADGDNKADSTEAYNFSTQVTSQISIVAGWSEIKKYTLIYNLDGGINSVDNKVEYSKDDLSFSLNPASKTGYIFKGWYADSNFENSITSENISEQALNFADKDYNLNLYAKFEINKYPYKIEYYYQNIKDDNYTIDTSKTYEGTAEFETKITTYEDKAGIGFKLKEVKPTILTITEKSDNIMKVYYDRDLIEVSFSDPGSTAIDSQTTKYSGIIEEPDNPKRDGYKFLGWYIDNDGDGTPDSDTEYDFDTPVTGKVNLVAKWKVINYKITYDLNGGTNSDDNPEKITIEDKIILSFPTRTGYDFDGWYDKEEKRVTDLTGVLSDIKLTAKWTPKQNTPYTIIHNYENLDGSYKEESIEKSTDTTDKQLDITGNIRPPTGFEINYDKSILNLKIKGDGSTKFEVYFKRKYYNITYDTNGGNEIKSETVKYEETLENSLPTPKKEGYIFDGWTVDDKDYDVTSKVDENVKLVAKWKADTVTYKVDYYQENSDGTFSIKNTEVKKAKTDEKVLIIPTEIYGYEIDTKNPEYLVSGIVKADGSLALKVFYKIKEYSVKYENVKTGETKEDIVKHGENAELEEQEIPEKKGYTFVGWLTQDGELFNPDAPIVSDVSLSLYYTPNTDTPFKVNYYKINDNKEYSFIGSNMYYGTTDTIVEVELKNLVGYKVNAKKSTIEGKILADGTAEFNVYYDVDNPNIVETGDIIYIIIAIIILLFITNSAITVKKRKKVNKKK